MRTSPPQHSLQWQWRVFPRPITQNVLTKGITTDLQSAITAVATTEAFVLMPRDMPVLQDALLSVVSVAVTQLTDSMGSGPIGLSDSFKFSSVA